MRIIDKETVNKILNLSRLSLSEEEKEELIPQLNQVLSHFKSINEIDTSNVEPMFHPPLQKLSLRKDESKKWFDKEVLERISPFFEKGFVKVPKIIEKKDETI